MTFSIRLAGLPIGITCTENLAVSRFADYFMIQNGLGLLVIPENTVSEFKKLLVDYYEEKDQAEIVAFLKEKCRRKF